MNYDNGPLDAAGRAFVYHGSVTGLSLTAVWTADGNVGWALFGSCVSTAGDVNGDGYADVIVGAHYYDNGQSDEGRAFLYYGNDGPGLSLRPQQRRADDTAPIGHLGESDSSESFGLRMLARTPYGRSWVKLEWEVKPLGTLFDGTTGLEQSTDWMDTDPTGEELNELATGLSADTVYHWRVRLLYRPVTTPFQQRSRWFTMPINGWEEADLRTAGQAASWADLNGDGFADATDLAFLLSAWGTPDADINGDGTTDAKDLAILLSKWNPGP